MRTGINLISEERDEQLFKHGRTVQRDIKENGEFQLARGARWLIEQEPHFWGKPEPWDNDICRNMVKKSYKERLIIAGALIAAEIDRINNMPQRDQK